MKLIGGVRKLLDMVGFLFGCDWCSDDLGDVFDIFVLIVNFWYFVDKIV